MYTPRKGNSKPINSTPVIPADYSTCEYDKIITQTDKGVLVDFGDLETWLPKSQVIFWIEGKEKRISMPTRLFNDKNL